MKTLHSDWFVEGLQDFEYKKYVLLAYLQSVKQAFDQSLLYPVFSDLISHYQNLHAFQQSKLQFEGAIPKQMRAVDWEKFQVLYASLLADDEALREIEEIVEFSLPQVKATVEEGKQLYELIEENIEIETVGLLPLYRDAGYLLLRGGNAHQVKAYSYQITMFESANERYRGIHSKFVADFTLSIGTTYESIKWELIRQQRDLPNPATFSVNSKLRFPEEASLVPVAKRKFVRFLAEFKD
jgi:tetratricopeptide (TPR) repeat protein